MKEKVYNDNWKGEIRFSSERKEEKVDDTRELAPDSIKWRTKKP